MTDNKTYRYPGVQPFRTQDSDIFFGRDEDKNKLFRLVMLEKVVVLFGKSGYGKSSLINAGIIPILNDETTPDRFLYIPLEVRIGKVAGQGESPVVKLISKLNEHFKDLPEWAFLDKYQQVPALWYHFKKKQSHSTRKFLLIFDQFEEFFNYTSEQQEIFRWELAELLFTDIPQCIRENLDEIADEQYTLLSSKFDIKVLFSIRSDRLSLLHSMKDALPRILDNRFEIKGLNLHQAEEAVKKPALLNDEKFVTHPFSYDTESMNIILKELATKQENGTEFIETFQLQIICQGCESKIEEKLKNKEIDVEINREDLPNFENLYEEYYKRQIEKLPPEYRNKAQLLLEENLIFEDEQSGEFHRLSVDGNILRRQIANLGTSDNILTLLENTFLIRREPNTVGGFSYEVSHDTIVYPIIKLKNERRIQEIKTNAVKTFTRRVGKKITWLALLLLFLLAGWKWKTIYFSYMALTKEDARPIIRLHSKLNSIVNSLGNEILTEAKKMDSNYYWGSWTASQLMTGLDNKISDSIKKNYFRLTSKALIDTCCCWREIIDQNDFRSTGWIVSAIGTLNLTAQYSCNPLQFLVNNQLADGSWSMLQIDKQLTQYAATYATCHVLRALHNTLPDITGKQSRDRINRIIDKGAKWLIANRYDTTKSIWQDYPKNKSYQALLSMSLSGLAIHTLNLVRYATPELNRQWLSNLELSQSWLPINHREQSDVFYYLNQERAGEAKDRDLTRHLVVPWQIIATIDAYKDGSFLEKLNANIWLDTVIENLKGEELKDNQVFIKAEIFIALRYLLDKKYSFQ